MARAIPKSRWRSALPGFALVFLVVLVYFPALRGEFLWDDDSNVTKSAPLRSLRGLWQIWTKPGATQQYYPITHSTFWVDYHLWGLNTFGYHVENVLLHALSAVLLWVILRRLAVPGAWLGAALFALHPVNVETVAWITERKNTLSGVFFMGSVLASVTFWRLEGAQPVSVMGKARRAPDNHGPWKFYWLALGLYLCALLSKTATIGLPAVILLLIWWKRGRPGWSDIRLLAPFAAVGVALGLVTIWLEKNHLGATGGEWGFTPAQRCIIAGRAFWFYLDKLFWPHPLMFMYPRWNIHATHAAAYVPVAAAVVALLILWRWRKGWARPVLLAIGCFLALLFPVLGFFNVVFYHYSFVSDHFQYLACIGPLALLAAGIVTALRKLHLAKPFPRAVVCGAILLAPVVLTWRQTGVYHDLETLWTDTLMHNPQSWMAHDNLGTWFAFQGKFDDATEQYREALEINPSDYMAYNDLGLDFARKGDLKSAVAAYTNALGIFPQYALGHYNLGNALAREGIYDEALGHYAESLELDPNYAPGWFSLGNTLAQKGSTVQAAKCYEKALQLEPDFASAHTALGRILASQGNLDGAITHYRAALKIDPGSVDALMNLANLQVANKQYDEAIGCDRAALRILPNNAVIHYNLGVALTRLGKTDEARTELAEARRLQAGEIPATKSNNTFTPRASSPAGQLQPSPAVRTPP